VDGLEILDLQALQVALGCLDAAVAEDLGEVKEDPASAEIN
jgi:hypothetical protein